MRLSFSFLAYTYSIFSAFDTFPSLFSSQDFLQNKRDVDGWNIVGTRVKKSKDGESGIETPKLDRSTILLIGTEGSGIPREILRLCNKFLHLPSGRALDEDMDSLNVSVASALLIHSLKQTEISINVKSD